MIKFQMNIGIEDEPEREFQPTLQCSSARPPVQEWPLGWTLRGSPEENTQIKIFNSTTNNCGTRKSVQSTMVNAPVWQHYAC